MGYCRHDTAWLDIHGPYDDSALARVMLVVGVDRDTTGHWEGRVHLRGTEDLTGDGFEEILIAIDVDYDLYPRQIMAVDWCNERVLWQFPVSGQAGFPSIALDQETDSLVVVVPVASKGNEAHTALMDDQHVYVLVLNQDGTLRWLREVGGTFEPVPIGVTDYDDNGQQEVFCAKTRPADGAGKGDKESDSSWAFFEIFDLDGHPVDTVETGAHRGLYHLTPIDLGDDDSAAFIACTLDSCLVLFDDDLQKLAECRTYTNWGINTCEDFLGIGEKQFLVISRDSRTWLLSREFEPLAQFEGAFKRELTNSYPQGEGEPLGIIAGVNNGIRTYYLSLRTTPWFSVFFRKPWLASVAAAVPLAVIILIVTVALLRIRQKNRVILAAQEELKATQAKLIAAEKFAQARSIAGGFAHEIRNALFPARTWLGKLRRMAGDDPNQIKPVDRTEQAVLRAIETTHKISMYTKLEENPPPEPVDFQSVLQESLREHQDRINELQVRVDVSGDTRTRVLSRPDLLKVVLDNLIRNALDALTETEIKRIIAVTGCAQGDALTVRFEDNGIGIDSEDVDRVFEAFYSTKPTTGTGLGLPMARKIMEMYDGSIEVTGQPDQGATFVLTFRIAN